MKITDMLASNAIVASSEARNNQQLFKELGTLAQRAYGLDSQVVVNALWDREKRDSTAMCNGASIPHARLPDLNTILGLFVRLNRPIDLKAPDGQGVDLVFAILSPEASRPEHLLALARVSRLLRNHGMLRKLRKTSDAGALYALITEPTESEAA